jgi:hypothetical protein
MEYAAGSSSGLLHQPIMFDTNENHGWPLPSATHTTWLEDQQKKIAYTYACHYCSQ